MYIVMVFVLCSNKFFTVFNDSCIRSAARGWNNAKRFLVAFSQSSNRFYLNSFKEPYIYDVHTEGVLLLVLCFQILLFLNNRSVVHFCGWGFGGVTELVIFCKRLKCMVPNHKQ